MYPKEAFAVGNVVNFSAQNFLLYDCDACAARKKSAWLSLPATQRDDGLPPLASPRQPRTSSTCAHIELGPNSPPSASDRARPRHGSGVDTPACGTRCVHACIRR